MYELKKENIEALWNITDKYITAIERINEIYYYTDKFDSEDIKRLRRKMSTLLAKLTSKVLKDALLYKNFVDRQEELIKSRVYLKKADETTQAKADKLSRVDQLVQEYKEMWAQVDALVRYLSAQITQYNKTLDAMSSEFKDIDNINRAIANQ